MLSDRINIQYSIDIDELPEELTRLLHKVEQESELLCKYNIPELSAIHAANVLSLNTLEKVDTLRRRLAAMDYILNDVDEIITGYLRFKVTTAEQNPESPPVSLDEPEELHANTLFNDLSELQTKVDELNNKS